MHTVRIHHALVILSITGLLIGPVYAATEEAHASPAGHIGFHHHKHHVALFLGITQTEEHEGERDDPQFTVGIDYERRLSKFWGVGLLADYVVQGHRALLLGGPCVSACREKCPF